MPTLEIFLLIFICISAVLSWFIWKIQKELKATQIQKIFEQKNESLIKNNKQQVSGLLAPLDEKIQNFFHSENKDRASLKEQIRDKKSYKSS